MGCSLYLLEYQEVDARKQRLRRGTRAPTLQHLALQGSFKVGRPFFRLQASRIVKISLFTQLCVFFFFFFF